MSPGLIEDRLTDGADKVPVLGDVPVVGSLFRYDARRRQKTNLMVFIKTTVLRNGADGRELTSERYQYLMGEQERQSRLVELRRNIAPFSRESAVEAWRATLQQALST